jgi:hypothetical protein
MSANPKSESFTVVIFGSSIKLKVIILLLSCDLHDMQSKSSRKKCFDFMKDGFK